ncbi:MAG: hypothetical protein J6P49_04605 [Paludibacteraceae bacterium]|nr:hypothetical protein [Paludibacteraceae bacterium]
MKKLLYLLGGLGVCGFLFVSCSNKSYEGVSFDDYRSAMTYTVASSGNTVTFTGENTVKIEVEEYVFDNCGLSVINIRREIECGTSDNAVLIGVGVSEDPALSKDNGYNVTVTWNGSRVYVNGTRDIYGDVASLSQEQLVAYLNHQAEVLTSTK